MSVPPRAAPRAHWLAALLGLALAAAGCRSAPTTEAVALREGRACTAWLVAPDAPRLWERLSDRMRSHFETPDALDGALRGLAAGLGAEGRVETERVTRVQRWWVYSRTATFAAAGPVVLEWQIEDDGAVSALHLSPVAAESAHPRTTLRLPFEGTWTVDAGGFRLPGNAHFRYPEDVFGVDFTPAGADCAGRAILAPAAGVVATAVDGVPDNPPGRRSPARWEGNHVVLDHENGERSVLAHLQQGSLVVRAGDRVAAGAPVGRCGNSGGSRRAHLHLHLVGADGRGIPAEITGYTMDGAPTSRAVPRAESVVAPR